MAVKQEQPIKNGAKQWNKKLLLIPFWVTAFVMMTALLEMLNMVETDPITNVLTYHFTLWNALALIAVVGGICGMRFFLHHCIEAQAEVKPLVQNTEKPVAQEQKTTHKPEPTRKLSELYPEKPNAFEGFMDGTDEEDELDYVEEPEPANEIDSLLATGKTGGKPSGKREGTRAKSQIGVEQSFKLSPFAMPAEEERQFILNCYNNTFRVILPEELEGFSIPQHMRKFFLQIDFQLNTDLSECINETIIDCTRIKRSYARKEQDLEVYLDIPFDVNWNIPKNRRLELDKSVIVESLRVVIVFTMDVDPQSNETQVCKVRFYVEPYDFKLMDRLGRFFQERNLGKAMSSGETTLLSEAEIRNSTRLSPFTFYSGVPLLFGDGKGYQAMVHCFYSFSHLQCPSCRGPVEDLGVRGIALYNSDSDEVVQTSNALIHHLNTRPQLEPVRELVDFCTHNTKESKYTKGQCLHIPLGKFKAGRVIPFTVKDYEEERTFLNLINYSLQPNIDKYHLDAELSRKRELYLAKSGKLDLSAFYHSFVHSEMIVQLCGHCWMPLPECFYDYHQVVTIKYFGNSNAGKTVLLCSEYNMLGASNYKTTQEERNQFNVVYTKFSEDKEGEHRNYEQIAKGLKEGDFPSGTAREEAIPGKLSEMKIEIDAASESFLFNAMDMMGVRSTKEWESAHNFVYVHSMLDDPSELGGNSFFQILKENMLSERGRNFRQYNVQIYLTKVDEYPLFLREKIETLNLRYSAVLLSAEKTERLNDAFHGQLYSEAECSVMDAIRQRTTDDEGYEPVVDHQRLAVEYMLELMEIFEQCLQEDFSEKRADAVIPQQIHSYIQAYFCSIGVKTVDFSKPYYQVHSDIVKLLLRPVEEDGEMVLPELEAEAKVILAYLHGLDNIRKNYQLFREMIQQLSTRMYANELGTGGNLNSYHWLSLYAVSATGYSAVESILSRNPHITSLMEENAHPLYQPRFVLEASLMLRHITCRFQKETQWLSNIKKVGGARCREYLMVDQCQIGDCEGTAISLLASMQHPIRIVPRESTLLLDQWYATRYRNTTVAKERQMGAGFSAQAL